MSTDEVRLARVALSTLVEPGSRALWVRVASLGPVRVLEGLLAGERDLLRRAAGARLGAADPRQIAEEALARTRRLGARVVIPEDDEWPHRLDDLIRICVDRDRKDPIERDAAPPLCLWALGPWRLDEALDRSVAVVGARAATNYGAQTAREIGYGLVTRDWTVVSGGAYGIDGYAHRGALAGGGATVVVLACGLDRPYPAGQPNGRHGVLCRTMTNTQARTGREYLRVSRDRSGRQRSVAEQHDDHQEHAERRSVQLLEPYAEDEAVSASRYSQKVRGHFARLLADLRAGRFGADELWLWESSRGSRKVSEWVELVEACESAGVHVYVTTHGRAYDPANARDRRSLLEDAVDSEYESAKSRERIRRATHANAKAGHPHGRLLYGYTREYDGRGRYLRQVAHPEQAPIVREVAQRVAAGESTFAIARDLMQRGIPTPGQKGRNVWTQEAINRLATNPGYVGLRVFRKQIIGPAEWDAILDEQTWGACVQRLSEPRRSSVKDRKLKYLLSGVPRCGRDDCGAAMRPRWRASSKKREQRYRVYSCEPAGHVYISQAWMDDFVTELVLTRMERNDVLELLTPPDEASAVAAAEEELAELEARLKGFYKQGAAGKLSPEGLAAIEADLKPQIDEARRRATPTELPAPIRALAGPHAREIWASDEFTVALRRETAEWLLDLTVMPATRYGPTVDPSRVSWHWRTRR